MASGLLTVESQCQPAWDWAPSALQNLLLEPAVEGEMFALEGRRNNHTRVLRNHMHTAENKQNYSFPKYLRVESLQKASNLSYASKIEFWERKEGQSHCEVSLWPSDRWTPRPGEHCPSWRQNRRAAGWDCRKPEKKQISPKPELRVKILKMLS